MFPNLRSVKSRAADKASSKWVPCLWALSSPVDLLKCAGRLIPCMRLGERGMAAGCEISGDAFLPGPCCLEGSAETGQDAQGQMRS